MRFLTILTIGLSITLMGCQIDPVRPTKPNIKFEKREGGGFCVDSTNAEKLGVYIQELEAQPR